MKKQTKATKICLSLFLIFTMIGGYGFACNSTGNPQTDSKIRTLARTEDDIAQGLKSTATIIKEANLPKEDLDTIRPILNTVAESNQQAVAITKSINAQGELPQDKQEQLLSIISFASDQLVQLNNEGTLRIKDPKKRLLFTAVVVTLQSSVTSLVPLLVKGK